MKNKMVVFGAAVLLVVSIITPVVSSGMIKIQKRSVNNASEYQTRDNLQPLVVNDGAELPTWKKDNEWIYDVSIEGSADTTAEFDVEIKNLKFKVVQVQSDQYKLDADVPYRDITGYVEIETPLPPPFDKIKGQLGNTKLDGTAYVQRSTLGFVTTEEKMAFEGSISGKVGILPFDVDVSVGTFVKAGEEYDPIIFTPLQFPLQVGDSWTIPDPTHSEMYMWAQVGILGQELWVGLIDAQHTLQCTGKETVSVPAGSYEAFKITRGSNNNFWYAPEAGNIVKVSFPSLSMPVLGDGTATISLEIKLKSTNYEPPNDPPEAPERPSSPDGGEDGRGGKEYTYCTSAEDKNNDDVRYGFDWGDGSGITWTDYVGSGQEACAKHTFPQSGGTFQTKAKTQDDRGAESDWSPVLTVTMAKNNAPPPLNRPSGPTSGRPKTTYTYSTQPVTDPDGDDPVKYMFDWGDGTDSGWVDSPEASHAWSNKETQTFKVKVRAKDTLGAVSGWSPELEVTIVNSKPDKPSKPSGPTEGKAGTTYTYSSSTTDPDGDPVEYLFDWGDGTDSGWGGPSASHKWEKKGSYNIKVKARDTFGAESDWSDPLPVTMPKNKPLINSVFHLILERFPILRNLLGT